MHSPRSNSSLPPSLVGLGSAELREVVATLGGEPWRARQLEEWLYKHRASAFEAMGPLPAALRAALAERYALRTLHLLDEQSSADGTRKFLFRTRDGYNVESVLIPSEARDDQDEPKRRTICVSTQVGCPLGCAFCATATMKVKRNLTVSEILEQVIEVERAAGERLTNLVFMGMGEPMLNYDNVMRAVEVLIDPAHELIPARRITLSTSGFPDEIRRLADEGRPIKLALSLHALTDTLRSRLMPINRRYPLRAVLEAIDYYYGRTRRPVTYEYILFDGLNDTPEDVRRLARIARRVPSRVNVIPFHPIDFAGPTGVALELHPTSTETFDRFIGALREAGVQVMVRSSSGKDIDAACGQLAVRHTAESLHASGS